jgi:hypothetical protein
MVGSAPKSRLRKSDMKLSLKKAQPAEAPTPSLAERIRAIRDECEKIIEAEVQRVKATDGQGLPIDWLRQDLRARTGGHCDCRCALKLMEPKQ